MAQLGLKKGKEWLEKEDRSQECQRGLKGKTLAALLLSKVHRSLYPDRFPNLEIESHICGGGVGGEKHTSYFLRRKHIIWGLQKWDIRISEVELTQGSPLAPT